jgi:anti-sigma factor RsiW
MNAMNALLARYLDGDLSPDEAERFLDALERDPELEARLRAHEWLLSQSSSLPRGEAPEGFAGRVMERVRERPGARRPFFAPRWRGRSEWIAAAAMLVLFFGLGWEGSRVLRGHPGPGGADASMPILGVMPAAWVAGADQAGDWMAVRFVYDAPDSDVSSVSVAGSFNGWRPSEIPMHREGGVWTAMVVLPRGNHEYMFLENGKRWVVDPNAMLTRDDGFGGRNAVLDLRT